MRFSDLKKYLVLKQHPKICQYSLKLIKMGPFKKPKFGKIIVLEQSFATFKTTVDATLQCAQRQANHVCPQHLDSTTILAFPPQTN